MWVVPAAGGEPRQLTIAPGADIWMNFSPDGRRIAYTAETNNNYDIRVVPASGGATEVLVDWPSTEWGPAYSPDGH